MRTDLVTSFGSLLLAIGATATAADCEAVSGQALMANAGMPAPIQNECFVPGSGSAPAKHAFSGVIGIPGHAMQTQPPMLAPAALDGRKTQLFPAVDLAFVAYDGYLVPVDRHILVSKDGESFWEIQVSPGRVWSQPGDEGMSRAAFPFILTSVVENETYNGLATFLYDDESVSQLRYQVVQQLAPFMLQTRFTAAGQVPIARGYAKIDATGLVDEFEAELADRLEWRDWSELEKRYGADVFADFDSGIDPALTVTSGLVIDGVVYVRSMHTPYGNYPYPREMRHGVWSVTKTAAGLLTLMRMAQKYGDEVLDYRIRDYVDVTATHDGWNDVTFRNAMSMATGIGTGTLDVNPNIIGSGDASDPANNGGFDDYMAWYLAPTLTAKLAEVFKVPSYPWGPGVHARYRDRDIFTLSAALAGLYRAKEGPDADIWRMMQNEVYRPIGIHHLSMNRTREPGGSGVPILAWGIYVTIDDLAKIAMLLQDGGAHNGVQLLSKAGVAEAMYRTSVRGLPTGESNKFGPKSYYLSLWHEDYVTASGHRYDAPRMSGYGGNIVQLMPNGIVGFRLGSGGDKPLEQMTVVADRIRPFDGDGGR